MEKKNFVFDCINPNVSAKELMQMVYDARQITWETFRKHINLEQLKSLMPDVYSWNGSGLHIKDDYAVSFWKTKVKGVDCYFVSWSSIEYFFI